jgi:cation:H+ antiporter
MTGSNRLLLGLGWSSVVLVSLAIAKKRTGRAVRELTLTSRYRIELGFLAIASVVAFLIPITGQIPLVLGFALLGFFVFYLWKVSRGEVDEPELVGPAATSGALPTRARRTLVVSLFLFAAGVILACAEPFAHSLIGAGTELGVDQFLLVQWLAPLASEAPEFIVAILFAIRGKGAATQHGQPSRICGHARFLDSGTVPTRSPSCGHGPAQISLTAARFPLPGRVAFWAPPRAGRAFAPHH